MPSAEIIAAFAHDAWARRRPGVIEAFGDLQTVEREGLAGRRWRCVLGHDRGHLVAAAPTFCTDYPLEATLNATSQPTAAAIQGVFPNAVTRRQGQNRRGGEPVLEGLTPTYITRVLDAIGGRIFVALYDINNIVHLAVMGGSNNISATKYLSSLSYNYPTISKNEIIIQQNIVGAYGRDVPIFCNGVGKASIIKIRLGSIMLWTKIYFQPRICVLNGMLRLVAFLLSADLSAVALLTGLRPIGLRDVAPC